MNRLASVWLFSSLFLSALAFSACISNVAGPTASPMATVGMPSVTVLPSTLANPDCRNDSDCMTSGCSGEICQPKSKTPAITNCVFQSQYACYKPVGCLCQSGKCAWSPDIVQCVQNALQPPFKAQAISQCQGMCELQKAYGVDLSSGPCLSNSIVSGWVCDVVHNPRQPVDDLPQNQCSSFGKTASHFVEVDTNCRLVRSS